MSHDNDNIDTPASGADHEQFVTDFGANQDNKIVFNQENSAIDGLKAIVLSIDWEITDQSMQEFAREIEKLKELWGDEKVPLGLLKILGAIGEYISNAKDLVHPDSIKLLHSVYNNFEKVVITPAIPASEKQSILVSEFAKYNELKEELRKLKVSALYENVGKRYDEISAASSVDTPPIQQPEVVPIQSSVQSEAVKEELDEESEAYQDIELTPGVDGIIDEPAQETDNVDEAAQAKKAPVQKGAAGQAMAAMLSGKIGSGGETEKEFAVERVDDVSFAEVDQRLDDFFEEDELLPPSSAKEDIDLAEPAADDVVMLAVDDEVVSEEVEETGTEIDLEPAAEESTAAIDQSLDDIFEEEEAVSAAPVDAEMPLAEPEAEDDSVSVINQSLDDFFNDDEAVTSIPLEESGVLAEAEADDVAMLAVNDEIGKEGGAEAASALAIDQRLDDIFDDDVDVASPPPLEEVAFAEPEAETVLVLAADDEIHDDFASDSVIELHQEIEEQPPASAELFAEPFDYGESFPQKDVLATHDDQLQPVEPLKNIIVSINQGLSEQSLQDFREELIRLRASWEKEKVLLIFLHLLESLADHLKTMGEHKQPNTNQLLSAISQKLEKAACVQRNDILQHEMLLEAIKLYIKWNEKNIGAVLLPEQKEPESVDSMILLGPAEEVNILEPID